MSNIFKLYPTHFSRGQGKILGGFAPTGYGPDRVHEYAASGLNSTPSGVQRSSDNRGDWLIGCPLPNSSIEQWRRSMGSFLLVIRRL